VVTEATVLGQEFARTVVMLSAVVALSKTTVAHLTHFHTLHIPPRLRASPPSLSMPVPLVSTHAHRTRVSTIILVAAAKTRLDQYHTTRPRVVESERSDGSAASAMETTTTT
jgi:hypothetical protein